MNSLKWRKVIPGHPKWVGFQDGRHVVTILHNECCVWRAWVDGGQGFQEIIELNDPPTVLSSWKTLAAFALAECRALLEQSIKETIQSATFAGEEE